MVESVKKMSLVLLPLLGFLVGITVAEDSPAPSPPAPSPVVVSSPVEASCTELSDGIETNLFLDALRVVKEEFVDPEKINADKIEEYMTRGLVLSLGDPYTDFFTGEEAEEFTKDLNGDLEGIGAALEKENGAVVVTEVLQNTPAAKSGILPRDVIVEVEGQKVDGLSLPEIVGKIRGKKGTLVRLSLFREGVEDFIPLEIMRDTIHVESVEYKIQDGIAIFTVSQFSGDTKDLFQKYLREALLKNISGIIIDLRYNTGGYLDEAVKMASFFLPPNEKVVTVEYRKTGEAKSTEIHLTNRDKMTDLPLVILINGASASASEIFAGAMRDHNRAILVGEKSFGKGSVQKFFPVGETGGKIKLTIAKWFTPNGENITEKKISPDLEVERTLEDFKNDRDPQLERAMEAVVKIKN